MTGTQKSLKDLLERDKLVSGGSFRVIESRQIAIHQYRDEEADVEGELEFALMSVRGSEGSAGTKHKRGEV